MAQSVPGLALSAAREFALPILIIGDANDRRFIAPRVAVSGLTE